MHAFEDSAMGKSVALIPLLGAIAAQPTPEQPAYPPTIRSRCCRCTGNSAAAPP